MRRQQVRSRMVRSAFLTAFGLALSCLVWMQPSSVLYAQGCPLRPRDVPALSSDSIGPLRLDERLGRLRELCGTARDTTVRPEGDAPPSYPGLVFHFDSLTVIALQYGASAL